VILEISLKVLPAPEKEVTLRLALDEAKAIETMSRWAGQPLPVSATCYAAGALSVRLSGSQLGVDAARARLGGDTVPDGPAFWRAVREQTLDGMRGSLWRLSVKPTTPPLGLRGTQVIEWNGSLRGVATETPAGQVFGLARKAGGHATRFRGGNGTPIMRLDAGVLGLHKRLKAALDPDGIFGPHRLHPDF
jgi:glycolate oxidase FAD binding subunit